MAQHTLRIWAPKRLIVGGIFVGLRPEGCEWMAFSGRSSERRLMRLFKLLVHESRAPAPSLELMTVRDPTRARELATKRLRESPRSERIEVWEGEVSLFNITRADLGPV
jgi:hypothetical protein